MEKAYFSIVVVFLFASEKKKEYQDSFSWPAKLNKIVVFGSVE